MEPHPNLLSKKVAVEIAEPLEKQCDDCDADIESLATVILPIYFGVIFLVGLLPIEALQPAFKVTHVLTCISALFFVMARITKEHRFLLLVIPHPAPIAVASIFALIFGVGSILYHHFISTSQLDATRQAREQKTKKIFERVDSKRGARVQLALRHERTTYNVTGWFFVLCESFYISCHLFTLLSAIAFAVFGMALSSSYEYFFYLRDPEGYKCPNHREKKNQLCV